jgi:hypothetical protein
MAEERMWLVSQMKQTMIVLILVLLYVPVGCLLESYHFTLSRKGASE